MQFSDLLNALELSPGHASLDVPSNWMQGRSVFGGLQAVVALAAMRTVCELMPLRTLQATFMAPPQAGKLTVRASVLRAGKNTRHIEARLYEGDQTLGVVIGVFGDARESVVERIIEQPLVDDSRAKTFPYIPGLTPAFLEHFRADWLKGRFPLSGKLSSETVVRVSMLDSAAACSEYHLLAIADFMPPLALSAMSRPVAGSTLTWMVEFLDTQLDAVPLENWRLDTEMRAARDGYTSQQVTIWRPDGVAAALSHQTMVVFG
ncbi:Acyl-CoA thioesterase II [gamma proteobacterium HdN1]|nr:Acyl-CoA thioesterase II [gamma proteobacterium HdN1]